MTRLEIAATIGPSGARVPFGRGSTRQNAFHAGSGISDEGVPFRDIAGVIGRHLSLPVVTVPAEDADEHFDWVTPFVQIDNWVSSTLTQKLLGWHPDQPGLMADLEEAHYFTDAD